MFSEYASSAVLVSKGNKCLITKEIIKPHNAGFSITKGFKPIELGSFGFISIYGISKKVGLIDIKNLSEADKSKYLTPTQAGCDAGRFHDDENEEEG